jgi:hypothetical protein
MCTQTCLPTPVLSGRPPAGCSTSSACLTHALSSSEHQECARLLPPLPRLDTCHQLQRWQAAHLLEREVMTLQNTPAAKTVFKLQWVLYKAQ